jgi:hypothetical protein
MHLRVIRKIFSSIIIDNQVAGLLLGFLFFIKAWAFKCISGASGAALAALLFLQLVETARGKTRFLTLS